MPELPGYYERSLKFVSGFTGSYRMTGAIGRILNLRHGYPITMFVNRSMRDPDLLVSGAVDFHWFVPKYTANWAMKGSGEYAGKAAPNLRGVAIFPQDDLMLFGVAPHCDVESIADVARGKRPLKIGIRGAQYFVEELLREAGTSFEDIDSRGGHVYANREELGTSTDVAKWCIDNHLDAVFGEAMTQRIWRTLAADGWRFIAVDDDLLQGLERRLEVRRSSLPVGLFPTVNHKLPTIDQSDFQLACRSELPDDVVYLVAKVIDENKGAIERATAGVDVQYSEPLPIPQVQINSPLTGPIKRQWECTVPLHPGAERYYREAGYLD